MGTFFVVLVSAALAAAWIPVGIHFWCAWRKRKSPMSLAICGLAGLQVYMNGSVWLFLQNDPLWVYFIHSIGSFLVLIHFLYCFRKQKKFEGTRQATHRES